METAWDKAKLVIRILIGGLFIFTAILKLISIDHFTVYIYSFNIFNYALSALVARAVIAAEFVLGCMLIAKIYYKQAWWLTMAMLVGFTFLLIYTAIFRNDTNCHCFGELVELDPVSSILKNIVTIALMLCVRKEKDYGFHWWKIVFGVILACGMLVPFCAFPSDNLYAFFFKDESTLNETLFEKSLQDSTLMTTLQDVKRLPENDSVVFSMSAQKLTINDDKYIIAMLSSVCPHCILGMKKANAIFKNNNIDHKHFKIMIWGSEKSISRFLKETESESFETRIIHPYVAIELVNGAFPTFIFIDHGRVERVLDSRELSDNAIEKFLTE